MVIGMNRDNPIMKIRRAFIYLKPVDKTRHGKCKRCGACCKFTYTCPFLSYDKNEKAVCKIYRIRGHMCRKYPLSDKYHETRDVCGFKFKNKSDFLGR
jgi:Fe-S-cluster containining protein